MVLTISTLFPELLFVYVPNANAVDSSPTIADTPRRNISDGSTYRMIEIRPKRRRPGRTGSDRISPLVLWLISLPVRRS
ncbi:hypothetical protein C8R46DRAFT_135901 [Mycena filopes]|nr:hypothetical protein C8R46DRAFT_135901 [Mycena filopes]